MSDGFTPARLAPAKAGVGEAAPAEPAAPALPPRDPTKVAPLMLETLRDLTSAVAVLADAVPQASRLATLITQMRLRLQEAMHHASPPPPEG